jgi:hypothetical protein
MCSRSVAGRSGSFPSWGTLARNGRDPHLAAPMTAGFGAQRVRVMVVENHQVVAEGLPQLLNAQPDMVVVGDANSAAFRIASSLL